MTISHLLNPKERRMSLQQKLKTLDQRPWTMTAVLPASQLFQLDLYAQIFLDSLRICTIDDEI